MSRWYDGDYVHEIKILRAKVREWKQAYEEREIAWQGQCDAARVVANQRDQLLSALVEIEQRLLGVLIENCDELHGLADKNVNDIHEFTKSVLEAMRQANE